MRLDEMDRMGGNGKFAAQAYWNALRKFRNAWREAFDEELEVHGSRAMEAFESALESFKDRFRGDETGGQRLLDRLDVQPGEDIREVLLNRADLDDLAPNTIKEAIFSELLRRGAGRFELRPILRVVLDELFGGSSFRRPRVGPNRHWPRLHQYLLEIEEETDRSPDGQGVRLANIGGHGPVARAPRDPGKLSVVINPDYI